MISQEHFSKLIEALFKERLPEFYPSIKYKVDDSFYCELRNPSNEISIWITTENSEITIGVKVPNGNSDIHTHISCYEEDDIEDSFNYMVDMINGIRTGKIIIYQIENSFYKWTKSIDAVIKKEKGKEIKLLSWTNG